MARLKKAICLLCVFVMTATFMVGCALFERDIDYYNNLTVATVGSDIRITKEQLMQAYNSFGFQFVTQQGLSVKEAYDKTLEELIDREIMVELSIHRFSFGNMNADAKAKHVKGLRGKKGIDSLFYDALYENEKAEARKNAFDAVDRFYVQLQDKVREERKLVFKSPDNAEDPNLVTPVPAQEPLKIFEPLVKRNATNTAFDMDISAFVGREVFDVAGRWSPDIDDGGDSIVRLVKTEALARLVRVLGNNEKGMKVGTKEAALVDEPNHLTLKERAIIGREIGRMIEENSKSLLLRRFQDIFDLGIGAPIDRSQFERKEGYELAIRAAILGITDIPGKAQFDSASAHEAAIHNLISAVAGGHIDGCVGETNGTCVGCKNFLTTQTGRAGAIALQAQNFYRSQVMMQYNRFVKRMDTEATLAGKVLDDLSSIYWLPRNVAENHFTVSHILIQYNDEQKMEFENIKSQFGVGGFVNVGNYNDRMMALASKLQAPVRDEKGVETGETKFATAILQEIKDAIGGVSTPVRQLDGTLRNTIEVPNYGHMDAAQKRAEEARRINVFRDFIYKYNQDPGMNNAEFEYVMGIENSKMVPEFTDISRELFGYHKVARMVGGKPVFDAEGNPVFDWIGNEKIAGAHLANCDFFRKDAGRPVYDDNGVFIEFNKIKCDGCKNGFTPHRSSMSAGLVMTDFGAHIVMYTRPLSDFIYNTNQMINFESFESDLNRMINGLTDLNYLYAPLTSYGDIFAASRVAFPKATTVNATRKTWFDTAVEKATRPDFQDRRNGYIVNFKNERKDGKEDGKLVNKITIHRGNFKDLFK